MGEIKVTLENWLGQVQIKKKPTGFYNFKT